MLQKADITHSANNAYIEHLKTAFKGIYDKYTKNADRQEVAKTYISDEDRHSMYIRAKITNANGNSELLIAMVGSIPFIRFCPFQDQPRASFESGEFKGKIEIQKPNYYGSKSTDIERRIECFSQGTAQEQQEFIELDIKTLRVAQEIRTDLERKFEAATITFSPELRDLFEIANQILSMRYWNSEIVALQQNDNEKIVAVKQEHYKSLNQVFEAMVDRDIPYYKLSDSTRHDASIEVSFKNQNHSQALEFKMVGSILEPKSDEAFHNCNPPEEITILDISIFPYHLSPNNWSHARNLILQTRDSLNKAIKSDIKWLQIAREAIYWFSTKFPQTKITLSPELTFFVDAVKAHFDVTVADPEIVALHHINTWKISKLEREYPARLKESNRNRDYLLEKYKSSNPSVLVRLQSSSFQTIGHIRLKKDGSLNWGNFDQDFPNGELAEGTFEGTIEIVSNIALQNNIGRKQLLMLGDPDKDMGKLNELITMISLISEHFATKGNVNVRIKLSPSPELEYMANAGIDIHTAVLEYQLMKVQKGEKSLNDPVCLAALKNWTHAHILNKTREPYDGSYLLGLENWFSKKWKEHKNKANKKLAVEALCWLYWLIASKEFHLQIVHACIDSPLDKIQYQLVEAIPNKSHIDKFTIFYQSGNKASCLHLLYKLYESENRNFIGLGYFPEAMKTHGAIRSAVSLSSGVTLSYCIEKNGKKRLCNNIINIIYSYLDHETQIKMLHLSKGFYLVKKECAEKSFEKMLETGLLNDLLISLNLMQLQNPQQPALL